VFALIRETNLLIGISFAPRVDGTFEVLPCGVSLREECRSFPIALKILFHKILARFAFFEGVSCV